MQNISGVEIVKVNGRIQVEQDYFVVASNLTQDEAEELAVKLIQAHLNRAEAVSEYNQVSNR